METRRTQLRVERMAGDEGMLLRGYAARFNSWSRDLGGFRERIMPGSFRNALSSGADVRFLQNHNPDLLFGRTKASTLRIKEDSEGLYFEALLPKTKVSKHLFESIERGDMTQCSFAFTVRQDGDEWAEFEDEDEDNGIPGGSGLRFIGRTLRSVDLFDVSAVTYPAYEDTSVSALKVSQIS